jgi:broad specificity phosphatase PhoE
MEVIGDDRLRERDAWPMAWAQKPLVAHRRELNGVESDQQLVTRFDEKMQEIYRQHSDQTVLAVAHGGVIPRRINHVCGTTYDRPGNTSISCVEYVLDEPSRCVRYGLMDHLC